MFKFLLSTLIISLFSACSNKNFDKHTIVPHTYETKDLDMIMQKLDAAIYETNNSALEIDDMKIRGAKRIVSNVKKATLILNTYAHKNLKEQDLKTFLKLSEELKLSALKIESLAKSYEVEKLAPSIKSMELICNRCHAEFRAE